MARRLRLRIQPADGEAYLRPVDCDELIVGRSGEADVQVMDRAASRHHTRLYLQGEELWVEDLGSRNGTRVNGQRIDAPTRLEPGDRVGVSGTRLSLEDAADGPPPPPSRGLSRDTSGSGFLADATSYLPRDPGPASADSAPELRRYADSLKLMNELHEALSGSLGLEQTLELVLSRVFEHLRPQQAVILLRGDDGEYRPAARRSTDGDDEELFFSRSLVREVGERRQAALVLDTAEDERFAEAQSLLDHRVRTLLAAPLMDQDRTLGILALTSGTRHRIYGEEDLALLVSVASVAAMRLQAAERRRLEQELALARRIQERLLPEVLPRLEGYRLHASNVPSRWVSGDFYSVVERPGGDRGADGEEPGECVLLLADVSGKGMAASLLAASLDAMAAGPIEEGRTPEEVCQGLSRRLYRRTPPEKYATCIVVVLEIGSGRLRYCNAGHNPALRVPADGGEVETLDATGSPLALLDGATYRGAETRLGPGDSLVLYTDGFTEASDPDDEEYGLERLVAVCRAHAGASPDAISAAIEADLAAFARGVAYEDDRTLVVLQRRPAG